MCPWHVCVLCMVDQEPYNIELHSQTFHVISFTNSFESSGPKIKSDYSIACNKGLLPL